MPNEKVSYESKIHGRIDFPYIVYMGKIPEFLKSFPLHWHEEMEIIWIESGTICFQVLSENLLCSAGDILVIPPNCIHDIKQNGGEIARYFNILFKFELLESNENSNSFRKYFKPFLSENRFQNRITAGTELNTALQPLIKNLIENRREKYETQELMVKSKLFEIIYNLQNIILSPTPQTQKNNTQLERLKPLLKEITENFRQEISVKQAADICAMSEFYFMKFFKKITGTTFINYVNQIRLENAQTMIRTTDKTISQIADECGFQNFSYFIRTFKSFYGHTPNAYRKLFKA